MAGINLKPLFIIKDITIHKISIKYLFFMLLSAIFICHTANELGAQQKNSTDSRDGIHAEPWAFGHSPDREAPIWQKGRAGSSLLPKKKKTGGQGKASASNTAGDSKSRIRSSLDLSVQEEAGTWKVTPSQKDIRPDENRVRENKHILGAYAGMDAGDDFNIKVGPELIIRDDAHGDESAYTDQPDSAFGLGMKFKYDF